MTEDKTSPESRIEDNILMLETKLMQKEKECADIKKQIGILQKLVVEHSVLNNESNSVSTSLKTKVTLLRLQKQYGTDFYSQENFKQHPTVPTAKHYYKASTSPAQIEADKPSTADAVMNKSRSKRPVRPKTCQQAPPSPPPQFPITIDASNKTQKISVVRGCHRISHSSNSKRPRSQQSLCFLDSKRQFHADYGKTQSGKSYNDIHLSGNLQRFMRYNQQHRNYQVHLATTPTTERGRRFNITDGVLQYPKDMRGSQCAVNQLPVQEKAAFQRTDMGSVTNFLAQDGNDPVFSKEANDWHSLHGKTTSLNQHIV